MGSDVPMPFNSIKLSNGTIKVIIIDSNHPSKKRLDSIYTSYDTAINDIKNAHALHTIKPMINNGDYLVIQTNNDKLIPFILLKLKEEGVRI